MGNRSQVPDQFVARHADAVVADDQQAVGLVRLDRDFQRLVGFDLAVDQRQVPKLVERIRGVRHEFADRDLAVLIQRVRQQVQQLLNFRLKREFLRGFRSHWFLIPASHAC